MSQLLNRRTHSVINHNLGGGSACPPASAAASAAGQRKQGHSEVTQASRVCVGEAAAPLTWCLVPSSMGSILHCICRTWDTAEPLSEPQATTEPGCGCGHGAAWFLPSWSPALRAQEWEFSLRGALWATSPPPAEAVVDKVSRTPSEGRSRSWDVRAKDARRQDNRGVPVVLRRCVSLPHVFQELVQLEGRKLREPRGSRENGKRL